MQPNVRIRRFKLASKYPHHRSEGLTHRNNRGTQMLSVLKLSPKSGRTCGHVTRFHDTDGCPIKLCGKPARFDVESTPMCEAHAKLAVNTPIGRKRVAWGR
jgi:hypothetical protein